MICLRVKYLGHLALAATSVKRVWIVSFPIISFFDYVLGEHRLLFTEESC